MSEKIYAKQKFLGEPTEDEGGYITAKIERYGLTEVILLESYFVDLVIGNFKDTITFDLDFKSEEEQANTLRKLELLMGVLAEMHVAIEGIDIYTVKKS